MSRNTPPNTCGSKALWEQGLPTIAAPRYPLETRIACIASKLCSHKALLPQKLSPTLSIA
ncbi:hypothetical protein CVG87_01180 [Pseudomonas sp. WCS365]|nr:hypothetical protein CVG87_01180 [Pseudomonas sp. WCS365]